MVSVWGRFHGFDLARELAAHDALSALITSYPRFSTARFGLERETFVSLPVGEVVARAGRRVPRVREAWGTEWKAKAIYQRQARSAFAKTDGNVFVGWASTCLELLRDANDRGLVTIVERGSAHIVEQTAILREEYARFGLVFDKTPDFIIEQNLAEYAEADYISVPTAFARDTFVKHGTDPAKILVNPYGTDLSTFSPRPADHDGFRIIQAGQVSIRKGFHYVIEAFRQAALPESELWFVGAVSDDARRYLNDNPTAGVRMLGAVGQAELAALYNQCDLFCLGSVEEGLAMVVLQAAACGLPIVATERTGADVLVRGEAAPGAVLVAAADSAALAEAFTGLWADPLRRRALGQAAHARVAESFSWRAYGDRAMANYRQALAEKPVRS